MTLRTVAQNWLSGKLELPISRHLPYGLYLGRDIRRLLPDLEVRQIFDVGANKGQTALQYAATFPKARIDSFEPVKSTYDDLVRNVARNPRIRCHHAALAESSGTVKMVTTGASELSRIDAAGTQTEPATTAQQFSTDNAITHVNLFKIDTEGHDLKVLRGAEQMICQQSIDLIEVEAGMNPENSLHVYFSEFVEYLSAFDYRIFGIYEQIAEWKIAAPNLRRANIAFISRRLIDHQR